MNVLPNNETITCVQCGKNIPLTYCPACETYIKPITKQDILHFMDNILTDKQKIYYGAKNSSSTRTDIYRWVQDSIIETQHNIVLDENLDKDVYLYTRHIHEILEYIAYDYLLQDEEICEEIAYNFRNAIK